jgi:hypothetical protein
MNQEQGYDYACEPEQSAPGMLPVDHNPALPGMRLHALHLEPHIFIPIALTSI